ncbi:B12-binding domain-containing radical SAM protein [Bacteroidota bacterium]
MNVLLVYPRCPDSFWSFKHALKFISKKAVLPPLGLITVSAMLPAAWKKKLVDMNVTTLRLHDIEWADFVFISAMYIQKESVAHVIAECKKLNKKIVAGGPLFTREYESYPEIDHFILNEAEITMPHFLADFHAGCLQRLYRTNEYADMAKTPVPDYHLLDSDRYASMNIQVSRGCPFACDFCEITALLGRRVRMKEPAQIIEELETLYRLKWGGPVFIVDDNFIGNKKEVKNRLLPEMKDWMQRHKFPFTFNTETTINLADDPELMSLMVETGFDGTFIGIETPEEQSLQACNKTQNKNRDMIESVVKIQKAGMKVSGGFIVGFDSDSPGVFQRQIDFIQKSGIVIAMVGLLNAPKNTRLYERLEAENRITDESTGNNTDLFMNFKPKMDQIDLLAGYKKIISNIYGIKPYYKRIRQLLLNYNRKYAGKARISLTQLGAFFKSILIIGMFQKGRREYWKLLIWTLFKRPRLFAEAITLAVYGYHYRNVYGLSKKNS